MAIGIGFVGKLRERLAKTRGGLVDSVRRAFSSHGRVDEEVLEEIEAILIQADIGVETTMAILEEMREACAKEKTREPDEMIAILKKGMVDTLQEGDHTMTWSADEGPHVTLVAGVNGSGKTTTVGKLASKLTSEGKSVMLGAADTFRAAAVEQLTIWSDRAGVPIVKHQEGSDPAAVAFDAADSAISRGIDCLIIDTAGRLHTKVNLMEELRKIQRVLAKRIPGAPHQVLLVLDATTGQNGLQQARQFTETLDVSGIILTKLDGTAKGGMIVAIQRELGIPIKMVGIGESADDLQPFSAQEFVDALFDG